MGVSWETEDGREGREGGMREREGRALSSDEGRQRVVSREFDRSVM